MHITQDLAPVRYPVRMCGFERARWWVSATAVAAALAGCTAGDDQVDAGPPEPEPTFDYPLDDVLRLNHLQAKSTHNSYHIEGEESGIPDWAYTHAPLDVQLGEQGVRHFELDLYFDYDRDRFEVFHLPLVDEQTTCRLLTSCLTVIKAWSDEHRAHHPIVVQVEGRGAFPTGMVEHYFQVLEAEIRSVWPLDRIVTPDLVRGEAATLAEAMASGGWPSLGQLRGRVLFAWNDMGAIREAYTRDLTSLDGRLLFVESVPGEPFGAYAVHNDPVSGADAIAAALAAGFVVRTRADSGGVEPRAGDTSRLQAALASGAHFISTDFPAPVNGIDYWLDMPEGTPSRCNPHTAPAECFAEAIEDPDFVGP